MKVRQSASVDYCDADDFALKESLDRTLYMDISPLSGLSKLPISGSPLLRGQKIGKKGCDFPKK